jgi:predicted CXXCH cytochrome family protein
VARTRTTKKLAQRIDLNYFKRPTPYKRTKLWLTVLLPVLALLWIGWRSFAKDSSVYSSGRMSAGHAVLERECAACHLQKAGVFSEKVADRACLSCHDGPIHHASQKKTLECTACHTEHRGRVNIAATSNQMCAECHSDLNANGGAGHYAAHISSLQDGHPQFAAVREGARDPGTIKLNHAIHMKQIRRGPTGPFVQLQCSDCHRAAAVSAPWTYADAKYTAASHTYSDQSEALPVATGTLPAAAGTTGRELMAPVKFATACAACHLLTFDKRFTDGVPHDKPEVIHAFLLKRFQEYIAAHPSEVRVVRDPNRDLTGRPIPPEVRILPPAQWVAERTVDAEELLWRKTCNQCHTLTAAGAGSVPQVQESSAKLAQELPRVAPSKTTVRWMPHAKFDHDAHRGFTCVSCHEKALTSKESSDVLVPGVATCQTCHAPGADHAEARCFECHTYHDWSQRKEVTPQFTLPALRTGGR